ncbi:MAG: hypothetical protein P1U36_07405, partial [Legionellaceae bacterium]|nr:hypothetical protein [Legionellaceae bacterium]
GFTPEQMVAMASNIGGAQALKMVTAYASSLLQAGHSLEKITALAARLGGAGKIYRTHQALSGISLEDIEVLFELLENHEPNNTDIYEPSFSESIFSGGQTSTTQHADTMQDEPHEEAFDELFHFDGNEDEIILPATQHGLNPQAFFSANTSKRPHEFSIDDSSNNNNACDEEHLSQRRRTK